MFCTLCQVKMQFRRLYEGYDALLRSGWQVLSVWYHVCHRQIDEHLLIKLQENDSFNKVLRFYLPEIARVLIS